MGVAGFTPFLQKICPTVFKYFPDRLKALNGKRIVIDGTLITQRLHFGSDSHPNHHVWGWYKLSQELKQNNISAICVFDGTERSAAKKDELKRRREARELTLTRGSIEDARFQRLHDLKSSIIKLDELDEAIRQEVVKILKESDFTAGDSSAAVLDKVIIEKTAVDTEPSASDTVLPAQADAEQLKIPYPSPPPLTNAAELANLLKSLHLNYQSDVAKLVTLSTKSTGELDVHLDGTALEIEKTVTKKQYELTLQEGELWQDLSSSIELPHFQVSASANESVSELPDKSHAMATSFQKRNNPPTAKTYADSKIILKAMGIPCIEATGTIEAEALASAIVLEGHADYVVSEDTDVLVYEAPLIRNITAYMEPLLVISGADVRTELGLTRDAYVDFVLLLGTDFSQRIKNVGPMRAYDLIKTHGSIERVLAVIEDNPRYSLRIPSEAYLAQVQIARLVFATLPPVPAAGSMISFAKNDEEVKRLLRKYNLHDFSSDSPFGAALAGNLFNDNPYAL